MVVAGAGVCSYLHHTEEKPRVEKRQLFWVTQIGPGIGTPTSVHKSSLQPHQLSGVGQEGMAQLVPSGRLGRAFLLSHNRAAGKEGRRRAGRSLLSVETKVPPPALRQPPDWRVWGTANHSKLRRAGGAGPNAKGPSCPSLEPTPPGRTRVTFGSTQGSATGENLGIDSPMRPTRGPEGKIGKDSQEPG